MPETQKPKKEYAPPKVIHKEQIETRAVVCAMGDELNCGSGPIQS